MPTRRHLLTQSGQLAVWLAGLSLLPRSAQAAYNAAAFDAKTLAEVAKALGSHAPTESKELQLSAPDIAENGAVVPLGLSTALPGVKRMALLVEKNPALLSAVFEVSDAIEASFATRVKMGQSSNVYALALMADGRTLYTVKEVKVTLGGCGG